MSAPDTAQAEAERRWPSNDPALRRWDGITIDGERSYLVQRQAFEAGAEWQRSSTLSREDAGIIIDALIEHEESTRARKAGNPESTCDERAEACIRLIRVLGAQFGHLGGDTA